MRALVFAALLPACHAADVRAWNLEQLHAHDGHHHYSAALEGSWEYYFRHVFGPALTGPSSTLLVKSPKSVKDPAESCLEELLELELLDVSDPYSRARMIQWSARLAVEDPSFLSRERALYVLARAAGPLGRIVPAPPAKDRPIADPEAVSSALGSLVAAAKPLLGLAPWNPTAAAELHGSIELLRALNLDLDGARRSLDVACTVAERAHWKGDAQELVQLVTELEQSCVARAVAHGLADEAPRTQAAAVEASAAVAGHSVLAGLLLQGAAQGRTSPIVLERILVLLRKDGLVRESPDPGAPASPQLVEDQLRALYSLALNRQEPALRVAAMSTLSVVAGTGFESLREEDWLGWWDLHVAPTPAGGPHP